MKKDLLRIFKIIIAFFLFCLTTYLSLAEFFEVKSVMNKLLSISWFATLFYTFAMLINLINEKYK